MFNNKIILITGGTGSIGSEIVRSLLTYRPKAIRIFSRDESKQFDLQQELKEFDNIRYLIGDIRDKQRLGYAMEDVDLIFHAAALKHVPSCEYNPMEAIKTNVIGVQNIIETAIEHNVEKVIAISTDKVVNPTSTMGATKLLSEKLISAASFYKGSKRTIFACVRFGNVMGSRGSVIPLFRNQIVEGRPLTVTHAEMTRFMMSIPQAAQLVIDAAKYSQGGEVFVLKMPILKITDLAKCLIDSYEQAGTLSYSGEMIETGIRPGEKLYEELMTLEESERALENEQMFIIPSLFLANEYHYEGFRKAEHQEYSSKTAKQIYTAEIRELIEASGLGFSKVVL
ncbi:MULTISPECIES: UDP-N-acetylglucosamine 4,6-dehydratase family protein [Paenibacillus]|uniref:UDP-N-acetylglucosamine 4,6-dehydratase family protein n=1 Tax=Paenibacillus amylolyticus TaxID=1451 RepID=A0ABD8AR59_PAEAM|nr:MULTISPECIES: UDP-N-acetylglucosamine 4,6-dehydratase family protein [unclassified Paenibacillus]MBD8840697.1 polysaccharide biosynthesis protein [Paenibacillus sp. CFBP 13594]QZN76546.1 polysaccharide biosynthesis protein [Paenibacillus sp. DR312]